LISHKASSSSRKLLCLTSTYSPLF
jgi:hypothetical protein